ncbi:MAG: 4-(cytidine 5'-diphospho)-2-C-methyl-D-erythritol kinase [Clostridia bacterium]
MNLTTEKAYAKINLTLSIGKKRYDGYHDIETIMQPVTIYDTVLLEKSGDIKVFCSDPKIPHDKSNLAFKAAEAFFSCAKISEGVNIKIRKRIPVGGGLGGGSADAAAVLRGLNLLYSTEFSNDQLVELAAQIGSDVPFFIYNKTAICRGRGEIVIPILQKGCYYYVICSKGKGVNTRRMYEKSDGFEHASHDSTNVLKALSMHDLPLLFSNIYNDFDPICGSFRESVERIKKLLLQNGAHAAQLTGSGISVFGIFSSFEKAAFAAKEIFAAEKCFSAAASSL